jgi:hypothetical protein
MFKQFTKLAITTLLTGFIFAAPAYAANVSVRVEQPKSPTNNHDFSLNFVALDILGRSMTAKCYKQGPTDGGFVQFGSDIALSSGGNTSYCANSNTFMNENGTYAYRVDVSAGADTASDTTSVTYNTSGPGDVKDYSKTHTNSCEYTIHFKTAADSGKTVKVEVYRSENTSFNADSGSRVGTVNAGSDEAHDFTNTPPDCNKTYYYAIRAFDSSGNGSAVVGDNVTTNTVVNPTGTTGSVGAIPVSGNGGSVLGKSTGATGASAEGDTLGATSTTPSAEITKAPSASSKDSSMFSNARKISIGGGILLLGVILYAFWKKSQHKSI